MIHVGVRLTMGRRGRLVFPRKQIDDRPGVDAHRRKTGFAGAELVYPLAVQAKVLDVKFERALDVGDIENDVVELGDFDRSHYLPSFRDSAPARAAISVSSASISAGAPRSEEHTSD